MNKKGLIGSLIILLIIAIIAYWSFDSYYLFDYDKPCLEKIAKEFCEERGMVFGSVSKDLTLKMNCKVDERSTGGFAGFRFLDEEKEQCRRKND